MENIINGFQLPEKLSDCLLMALEDMEKIIKSEEYVLDFSHWHDPISKRIVTKDSIKKEYYQFEDDGDDDDKNVQKVEVCAVCFAGSVMSQRFTTKADTSVRPDHFSKWNEVRFLALDELRQGDVWSALDEMGVDVDEIHEEEWSDFHIDVDMHNLEQFKKDMMKVHKFLVKKGY